MFHLIDRLFFHLMELIRKVAFRVRPYNKGGEWLFIFHFYCICSIYFKSLDWIFVLLQSTQRVVRLHCKWKWPVKRIVPWIVLPIHGNNVTLRTETRTKSDSFLGFVDLLLCRWVIVTIKLRCESHKAIVLGMLAVIIQNRCHSFCSCPSIMRGSGERSISVSDIPGWCVCACVLLVRLSISDR